MNKMDGHLHPTWLGDWSSSPREKGLQELFLHNPWLAPGGQFVTWNEGWRRGYGTALALRNFWATGGMSTGAGSEEQLHKLCCKVRLCVCLWDRGPQRCEE